LEFNKQKKASLNKDDIDWTQSRVIFIARSFTTHQQNAVNFKNMPFELWEAVQFESDLIQYRRIETTQSVESLTQIKNITSETQKAAKEVKKYTEEDLLGKDGESHDLHILLKEQILQIHPDLVVNPKKVYIGYQIPNNWRNIFNVLKIRDGLRIDFTRSKVKDFDDPQKRLKPVKRSRDYFGQDMTMLEVKNEKDVRYAMLIIQQAYDRFIKEFGS